METNELPEADYTRIQNEAEYAASLMGNNRYIKMGFSSGAQAEYIHCRSALQSKEEELEGLKDEIETAREWMKVHEGENSKYLQIQEQLKAKDEELAKLTSALRDWGQKAEGWNKLESENERLRGLLEKCRPLAFHSTLDPKQNWNNQATELLQEIDLLSQSTDKHQEKIAGRPEDFPWPVKEDKSLIQRIEERLGVVYLNDVYTWIQFKNALELESTDKP